MKPKLKLKSAAGVQSRQIGDAFCFYEGSRPYRYKKLGKQIVVLPPAEAPGFIHPWKTSVRWYEGGDGLKNYQGQDIEGFGAFVNPGLVNGLDPVAIGAWRGNNSNVVNVPSQGMFSRAPGLLDHPIIPLPPNAFHVVGGSMGEGMPKVSIPLGLKQLGVVEFASDIGVTGSASSGTMEFNLNTASGSEKYAAITWLYVRTARPSVMPKGDVDASNGFFGGVRYNSKYSLENLSKWGNRSQFMIGPPPLNPTRASGPGAQPTDLGFDCFPIAEIWLVTSQTPRTNDNGKLIVDGGWIPFVRHRCFWNLEYRFDASLLGEEDKLQMTNPALPVLPLIGIYTIAPIATSSALTSIANEAMASNIKEISGSYWT